MLDGVMRKIIDPPLNRIGAVMARWGIGANAVTLVGLAFGLGAAIFVAIGYFGWALVMIGLSRLADGLDGAVARATAKTSFGGYLDIVADILFYGAVPFGFIVFDPVANGLIGGFLLATFYFNGATFLGYAILAERRGLKTASRGAKTLYFTGGLLEGTETIAFFLLICVWPSSFGVAATLFGAATIVTGVSRVLLAWQVFGRDASDLVEGE